MPPASHPVTLVAIDLLKPHEQVKEKKAAHYQRVAARKKHLWAKPILADAHTHVILDGHLFLLQQLGLHIRLGWRHEIPPRLPTRSHESRAR